MDEITLASLFQIFESLTSGGVMLLFLFLFFDGRIVPRKALEEQKEHHTAATENQKAAHEKETLLIADISLRAAHEAGRGIGEEISRNLLISFNDMIEAKFSEMEQRKENRL